MEGELVGEDNYSRSAKAYDRLVTSYRRLTRVAQDMDSHVAFYVKNRIVGWGTLALSAIDNYITICGDEPQKEVTPEIVEGKLNELCERAGVKMSEIEEKARKIMPTLTLNKLRNLN